MKLEPDSSLIKEMRIEAEKSPCKIIKFSASDGICNFSYNGEYYADCEDCKRTEIEQPYPNCKASHAEWGAIRKMIKVPKRNSSIYIYCKASDGTDYPFTRFWCKTCAVLLPMFGIKNVYMWDGNMWVYRDSSKLISEVERNIEHITLNENSLD